MFLLTKKSIFLYFAKDNDIFNTIENKLYQKYPEYIGTNYFFLVNGRIVNKYKTLKDNKIKSYDVLALEIMEDFQ